MTDDPAADRADGNVREQQRSLALALKGAQLSVEELWMRYFGMGGEAGYLEVDAYVHGKGETPALERDILAHAVNERIDELTWAKRAAYSRPLRSREPRDAPLSALVRLLEGAELAPPDRLPALAETAGRALGVHIAIYLTDYDQRYLCPLPTGFPTGEQEAVPAGAFEIDNTLPGRAFRQVQILPSQTTDRYRLWVPLMDGVERLGVLDVQVDGVDDLYDPGLRVQCQWVSHLLGHLVTAMSQYGDALERTRLRTRRTVNAELIWSLLPPLTAGVDSFVVTGVIEPRHSVSGDAFDYALSETTANLIVLDAVGHDLRSGLIAAAAVAAYRSARHAGHGLYEQARTIDETISRQFGHALFATAVLAELDLPTGRLRYINAGHPEPLLMRGGKIVKPLNAGHSLPLGLGIGELHIGEEFLQPDDWLLLYTDGVPEARDNTGEFFGETRLIDFLRREAAAGHPPPETARRLIKAVLEHQHQPLQDDATVLLARWTHPRQLMPDA
ncbi:MULTISPECIES: PP2C family protein-serine/threonine phosphatase [Nocardia]|uniref:PP2C family protein-serine/threonine phosphatase n=1 Tax=Nocardia abscessus TaxID=120957 RepID=UPI0018931B48|nr:PP2C family protein-serine/threonine phosphatase [Nocardia abscessus]MBF6476420.1 serine/threonine-protein phosphatase [Nocardia abscessus]